MDFGLEGLTFPMCKVCLPLSLWGIDSRQFIALFYIEKKARLLMLYIYCNDRLYDSQHLFSTTNRVLLPEG
jgi:hypothetical protein